MGNQKAQQLIEQLARAIEKIERIEAVLQAYESEKPVTLMTAKQLASHLGRSTRFVYRMKRAGFAMPGGLATPKAAIAFLFTRQRKCRHSPKCP